MSSVSSIIIIALIVAGYILSLFLRKYENTRFIFYTRIGLAVFMVVYGLLNREYLYISLFLAIIALATAYGRARSKDIFKK